MTSAMLRNPKTDADATLRLGAIGSVALLLIMALWLALTNINGAVVASGKAVVRGNPKSVQSMDGGLVEEILVSDGMQVVTGQLLLRFDTSLLELRRDVLRNRFAAALARQARLEAEFGGQRAIVFPRLPDDLPSDLFEIYAAGERSVFDARRAVLDGQKAQTEERKLQLENRIEGIEAQLTAVSRQHASVLDELAGLGDLVTKGLIPQNQVLELQRREADLAGRIATLEADLAEQRNAISEATLAGSQADRAFQEGVVGDLQEVRSAVEEQALELARIEADLARSNILAPVDGVVHEMQVSTIGGVVAPEQEMLKIIPTGQGIDFEVWVNPVSIDAVYPGQLVQLQFPAFDPRRTPSIHGTVQTISPDTVTDPATRQTYYAVGVMVSEDEMSRLGSVDLIPGMPINAFLQTHARSVLSYLVEPLSSLLSVAFRED